MRQVNVLARDNILGGLRVADDFGIACHLKLSVLLSSVEYSHGRLASVLACNDVDTLPGDELSLRSGSDHLVALAPVEQSGEPVEHCVLLSRASLACEGIVAVALEASGEVLAHVAVGLLLGAVHQYFGAVVELRGAVHGEQQAQCLLERQRVAAVLEEAVGVVVLYEGHHT